MLLSEPSRIKKDIRQCHYRFNKTIFYLEEGEKKIVFKLNFEWFRDCEAVISGYCQIFWIGQISYKKSREGIYKFMAELINILELIVFGKGNRIVFRK